MITYEDYVEIFSQFEEKYQQLHKLLTDRVNKQLDPLIVRYDADILALQSEYLHRAALHEGSERIQIISQLNIKEKDRYNLLLDQAKQYVKSHDKKISALNTKMLLAKQVLLERRHNESVQKQIV